jgi:hypothetical protein
MMSQAETEVKQPRGCDGAGKSGLTHPRGTYLAGEDRSSWISFPHTITAASKQLSLKS